MRFSLIIVASLLLSPAVADAATGTLKGTLRDVKGQAVEGGEVYVYRTKNTRRPAAFISPKTGPYGRYRVPVSSGRYWITARHRATGVVGPLGTHDRHSGRPEPVKVRVGENTSVDFVLAGLKDAARMQPRIRTELVTIRGTVLAQDGTPLSEWYVMASRTRTGVEIPDYVTSWTGADGTFALHVPKGTYWLGLADRFPPGSKRALVQKIDVTASVSGLKLVANHKSPDSRR